MVTKMDTIYKYDNTRFPLLVPENTVLKSSKSKPVIFYYMFRCHLIFFTTFVMDSSHNVYYMIILDLYLYLISPTIMPQVVFHECLRQMNTLFNS